MRILFLDDDESRWQLFWRVNYEGNDISWAKTAQEAKLVLQAAPRFDFATLDHDLAEEHYEDQAASGGTGQEVAAFIAAMPEDRRPKRVELHTYNGTGARAMRAILWEVGVVAPWNPFNARKIT